MSAKIDHIGIAVRSIDATLALYRDALGVDPGERVVVEHEKVEVAMLAAGGPRLELLEATSDDSVIAKFIEKRGGGLHHIAIRVPDLAAAVERVKAGGARLVKDEIQRGAEGYRYVFVHPASAGGVLLELIEDDSGAAGASSEMSRIDKTVGDTVGGTAGDTVGNSAGDTTGDNVT